MQKHLLPFVAALAFAASSALAESQWRVPSHFEITTNTGVGYSMFVVGSHPDLGDWDPLRAIPLAWHEGNVWSADIGLQSGTTIEYKFVKRPTDATNFPYSSQTEWWPTNQYNLSTNVTAEPDAPYAKKHVVFRCPWNPPVKIYWSPLPRPVYNTGTNWASIEMTPDPNMSGRFTADVCEPGEWMQFTFSHMVDDKEDFYRFYGTTNEDFYTPLDAFCVTAGQVFDYEPAGDISNSQIISTNVNSTADGIANRTIHIYLPRGYNENTSRRYPVLYFADGQNIFDPNADYGGWKVNTAADREIRGGRMREAILVGVPCRADPPPGASSDYAWAGRLWEYLPGTDDLYLSKQLLGYDLKGNGFNYMKFLLDNVIPTLNYNFRTLQDRANTGHVGSSAGGLLSFWLGAYTNRFGLVGAVSGVYNDVYIPKFRQWCWDNIGALAPDKIQRIWLDTGTAETNVLTLNLYDSNWDALHILRSASHIQNKSLHFAVYSDLDADGHSTGLGQHNEYAWAARSADILDFLLPVTDEFNPLLPRELSLDGNSIVFPVYAGETSSLVRVPSLSSGGDPRTDPDASEVFTPPPSPKPWSTNNYTPSDAGFYFIRSTPSP